MQVRRDEAHERAHLAVVPAEQVRVAAVPVRPPLGLDAGREEEVPHPGGSRLVPVSAGALRREAGKEPPQLVRVGRR